MRSLPLRDASTFMKWSVVEKGKGIPCYAGTGAFSLRRYIFPESDVVEQGKGLPCYAGTGAFSLRRYIFGRGHRRVCPFESASYGFVNFGKAHTCISFLTGTIGAMFFAEYFFSNPCCMNGENCEPNRK